MHVAEMENMSIYRMLAGKFEGKSPFRRRRHELEGQY
jgi:hypothetical protein